MKKRKGKKATQQQSQPTAPVAVLIATRHLIEWLTAKSQGKGNETDDQKEAKD
jgi:hypothetical protein